MRLNLKKIVKNVILMIALLLIANRIISVSFVNIPTTVGVISSGSMEPVLHRGDIILWHPADPDTVRVGDVIVYQSYADPTKTVTHRVVDIDHKEGNTYFTTKGDANDWTDQKGPHVPEPLIGEDHFRGKILSVAQRPLSIPLVGETWFFIASYLAGEPGAFPWLAFLIIGIVLLIFGSVTYKKAKKDKTKKAMELFFGPEKVRAKTVFMYALTIYVVILMLSTFTFHDVASASVGVNSSTPETDIFFEMDPGSSSEKNLTITAPSTPLYHKIVVFPEGDAAQFMNIEEPVFTATPRQAYECKVNASVPIYAHDGVYSGEIYVYSSPYWQVLPDSFMENELRKNPRNAVLYFDLISGFLLTLISVALLILLSKAVDFYIVYSTHLSWVMDTWMYRKKSLSRHRIKRIITRISYKCSRAVRWMYNLDWVDVEPKIPIMSSFVGLFFVPFAYMGYLFAAMAGASFFAGTIAYFSGCKWRAGIISSGILSTLIVIIFMSVVCVIGFSGEVSMFFIGFLTNVGVAFMLFFLIMLLPASFLSYLPACIAQRIRERKDPMFKIIPSDI
jgi:signal peptidase